MSFSGTALKQRERELKALKTFLIFSLVGSLGLHIGVLASGIVNLLISSPEIKDEPIEVMVLEDAPALEKAKPVETTKEQVKPPLEKLPQVPKQEVVDTIKTQSVEQIKPVEPPPVDPVLPKPEVNPEQPIQPRQTVVVPRKLEVKPQKIITAPVEKPIQKLKPEVTEPTNIQNTPLPAPLAQSDENLKQTLRGIRESKVPQSGGGGGGGGGGGIPVATGSGSGTVATGSGGGSGTGTGTGIGSGSGSGIGSGIGSGRGSGIGSGRGSGIGSGTGSGIGSGTGSGTQVATAPRPRPAVTKFDFVDCIKCDLKYPQRAERQGIEGRPGITFDVDQNGNVINIQLTRPSGHRELDEALVSQARKFKLNAAAAGKQNVQLIANFTKPGSRQNREALKRQREREEARRQRQAEAEKKKREAEAAAASETEATPGRRRRTMIPDSPASTSSPTLPTSPTLPSQQPENATQQLEKTPSSSPSNTEESPRRQRTLEPDTSNSENNLRDSLRRSQEEPSQPSQVVPSDAGGN
ncbi:hypothetical protein NUACC21_36640 [Scytonema sp. NUACC21]